MSQIAMPCDIVYTANTQPCAFVYVEVPFCDAEIQVPLEPFKKVIRGGGQLLGTYS